MWMKIWNKNPQILELKEQKKSFGDEANFSIKWVSSFCIMI